MTPAERMDSLPPTGEVMPAESLRRGTHDPDYDDAEGRLPEWLRYVRRVMRDYEEVRAHCRRPLEMVAAQREFLRGLDRAHGHTPDRESVALEFDDVL